MTRPEGGTSRQAGRAAVGWWIPWWPLCRVRELAVDPWRGLVQSASYRGGAQPVSGGWLPRESLGCCTWRGCISGLFLGISCQGANNCRVCGSCRCLLSSLLFADDTNEAASVKGTEWLPWGTCICSLVLATLPGRLKWRSIWKSVIVLESQAWF